MQIAQSKTIAEAFLLRCKHFPHKVAFRYKVAGSWKQQTYAQQFEAIRRLSLGLMDLGIKKGERVSILAQTSLAWGQFDLAIMGCGAITVPVYPTSTPEDVKFILNHAEVSLLFVDDFKNLQKIAAIAEACPKLKRIVVNFDMGHTDLDCGLEIIHWNQLADRGLNLESKQATKFEQNLQDIKPSDIFTICYTSGTTGTPKGVALPHSAMSSVMLDTDKVINQFLSDDEILLSFLPMSHIFGKWESMTPYYLGWAQAYAESIDALLMNLTEVKPTLWVAVPRIFEKAYVKIMGNISEGPAIKRKLFEWALDVGKKHLEIKSKKRTPNIALEVEYQLAKKLVFSKITERFGGRIKLCVSGSAPLAANITEFMHIIGVPVYEGYGLTETCAPVSVNLPQANKFGTVGKLLPEVLVRIAEDGEILVKSAKCFTEYYKNPEATAEAIKDGWFYTGDIGILDEDGFLKITDRKKDLIKTAGGKFIAPQKIENLAKATKYLSQIVVYGDEKPFVTALITVNHEAIIQFAQQNKILFDDFKQLLKNTQVSRLIAQNVTELNQSLARYETIKRFHVLPQEFTTDSGELTPSLKVKRKFLTQKYKDILEGLYEEEKH